eukprot:3204256-Rhodomonas_salina.2
MPPPSYTRDVSTRTGHVVADTRGESQASHNASNGYHRARSQGAVLHVLCECGALHGAGM